MDFFRDSQSYLCDTNSVLNKLNSKEEVKEKLLGQALLLKMLCTYKNKHV